MSKVTRYYVRRITETGEVIVEKSEILLRKDYIINVASQEESEPFDMVSEKSDDYSKAVKEFLDIESDNVVEAPVLI